jgi:hypothetical protein
VEVCVVFFSGIVETGRRSVSFLKSPVVTVGDAESDREKQAKPERQLPMTGISESDQYRVPGRR